MEADAPLWHAYLMEAQIKALAARIQARCSAVSTLSSVWSQKSNDRQT